MKRRTVKDIAVSAVFSAVLAILAQVIIPTPFGLPVTLQAAGVALCGFVLGSGKAAAAVSVYVALGAVGVPVFAGFQGGIAHLLSYTGGFLWSFPLMAIMCGIGRKKEKIFLWSALGLAVNYAIGTAQFILVSGGFSSAFWVLPFMVKDAALLWPAAKISRKISAVLDRI